MKEDKAYIGDEIVEGNILISQFMDCKIQGTLVRRTTKDWDFPFPFGGLMHPIEDLKYHSSWDWLMPVFREWITRAVNLRNSNPELNEDFKEFKLCLEHFIVCVDLQKAHITLAKAIKWYNQNKQS